MCVGVRCCVCEQMYMSASLFCSFSHEKRSLKHLLAMMSAFRSLSFDLPQCFSVSKLEVSKST